MDMLLDHDGRERARFSTVPASSSPLSVTFDRGLHWSSLIPGVVDTLDNWTADVDGTIHTVMVAGPNATGNPVDTVVLPVGITLTKVVDVFGSEIIIRNTGRIIVSSS